MVYKRVIGIMIFFFFVGFIGNFNLGRVNKVNFEVKVFFLYSNL